MTMTAQWVQEFGERVRDLRMARGWSQQELGTRAGKSQSAIRDIERGGRNGDEYEPNPRTVMGIARAFEVDGGGGVDLLRSVGLDDKADYLQEHPEEDDPLEGLSAAERAKVLRIARQIIDMGREAQSGDL